MITKIPPTLLRQAVYTLLLGLVACATPSKQAAAPASAVFTWQDELCDYQGHYRPQQVSARQLNDAVTLIYQFNSLADVRATDGVDKVRRVYEAHLQRLQQLTLPPSPELEKLRRQKAAQSRFFYDLALVEARALSAGDMRVLQQFAPARQVCTSQWQQLAAAPNSRDAWRQWHNCANHLQPGVQSEQSERDHQAVQRAFRAQLFNIKSECSEP
ncbi:hypothetical protein [Paralysiella testudinis]|uniref:Lipoprotein n=1 Tax=Paralysiella testudinis TaxID=2809020 RepID=A0A892ZN31_9NEIS|nr:hypothetical protein [Paralysiella testudinis]QRQ83106.1 hypothetical protein JQU52_07055 [Paralysiella testudinis]